MQVAGIKLVSTGSAGLWVHQTAARFPCKTKCVKLESASKLKFPMLRQNLGPTPSARHIFIRHEKILSRGSRAFSTGGSNQPDLIDFGISAGLGLALGFVIELAARGLPDALWDREEAFVKVCFKDIDVSYIAKINITNCKTEAELETLLREVFDVRASESMTLTFKPTGEEERSRFVKEFYSGQLRIAATIFIEDE